MTETLFESENGSDNSESEKSRIEELEERVEDLENAVLPSIRRVSTDNGDRFIIEQGTERWYKPETLKQQLNKGGN